MASPLFSGLIYLLKIVACGEAVLTYGFMPFWLTNISADVDKSTILWLLDLVTNHKAGISFLKTSFSVAFAASACWLLFRFIWHFFQPQPVNFQPRLLSKVVLRLALEMVAVSDHVMLLYKLVGFANKKAWVAAILPGIFYKQKFPLLPKYMSEGYLSIFIFFFALPTSCAAVRIIWCRNKAAAPFSYLMNLMDYLWGAVFMIASLRRSLL